MRSRLLLLVLFAAGCGKDVTKDIEDLADRACACKDEACGNKVLDDLVALSEKNKDAKGDTDRVNAAAKRMGACVMEAGVDATVFQEKLRHLK